MRIRIITTDHMNASVVFHQHWTTYYYKRLNVAINWIVLLFYNWIRWQMNTIWLDVIQSDWRYLWAKIFSKFELSKNNINVVHRPYSRNERILIRASECFSWVSTIFDVSAWFLPVFFCNSIKKICWKFSSE